MKTGDLVKHKCICNKESANRSPAPSSETDPWVPNWGLGPFFPLHMSSKIEGNSKSFVFDCGQIKQPFPEERNRGFFDEG